MNSKRLTGIAADIIILIIFFMNAGCSSTDNTYSQSLGSYKKSHEVSRLFSTYQYLPDYKYYYAVYMKDPEGVVGIHNDYLIAEICGRGSRAVHWHKFDTTPQNLELLAKGIALKGKPYGADIFDHIGKQIGILFTFDSLNISCSFES